MEKEWSPKWRASTQVRKQRKYRYNAPLHARRGFVSAGLSKDLRKQHGRRSFPLRKGDEVEVMRGKSRGQKGVIETVDLKSSKIYVNGVKVKKTEGREIAIPIDPSNVRITMLNLEDEMRQKALQKSRPKAGKKEAPVQGKK